MIAVVIDVEWFRLRKQWHNLSLRSQDSIGMYWITCAMKSISRRTEKLSQRPKWVTAFLDNYVLLNYYKKILLNCDIICFLVCFIKYGLNILQTEVSKRKRKYLISKLYSYNAMKWNEFLEGNSIFCELYKNH